jgi:hypothetical protein
LIFEDGDLRRICYHGRELIQRVYGAVRDAEWNTIPLQVTDLTLTQDAESFDIRYHAIHHDPQRLIDFQWDAHLFGDSSGMIRVEMDGRAHTDFLSNRIGWCTLHPMTEWSGVSCQVERADGLTESRVFPVTVQAQTVFEEVQGLTHEVGQGVHWSIRFEGDIFETEDQRNWMDSSFKTYSTPQRMKKPREMSVGTRIQQAVTFQLVGGTPRPITPVSTLALTRTTESVAQHPRIGVGYTDQPHSPAQIALLKALNLSHLRVNLIPSRPESVSAFQRAVALSHALGAPLELALFLSVTALPDELDQVAKLIQSLNASVWAIPVFSVNDPFTPIELLRAARTRLAPLVPNAIFGAGTDRNFIDLNAKRPDSALLSLMDYATHSVNPQVHATDHRTISETAVTFGRVARTASQFLGGKPLSFSPLTLRTRYNPDSVPTPATDHDFTIGSDPRQHSGFTALWVLCSLKYAAESGAVQHLTLFETVGERGLLNGVTGSPTYELLRELGAFQGGAVYPVRSSESSKIDGLLLEKNGVRRVLVGNWTTESQSVIVEGGINPVTLQPLEIKGL